MSNLQQLRIRKGLTQHELAAKSGVSLSSIQKYERGPYPRNINRCSAEQLFALAKALDCKMEDLLNYPVLSSLKK